MVKVYIIYRKLDGSKNINARVWQNTKYKKNVFYVFLFSEFPKKTGGPSLWMYGRNFT